MVVEDGFRTYEFHRPDELGSAGAALSFSTCEDALHWLTGIQSRQSDFISRLRRLLDNSIRRVSYGLTDQELLVEAASLLQLRRLVVFSHEKLMPQGSAPSAPPKPVAAVPFPLPPRRSASAPAPAQRSEDPTFSDVDAAAQAAVLLDAARSGAPFCPE